MAASQLNEGCPRLKPATRFQVRIGPHTHPFGAGAPPWARPLLFPCVLSVGVSHVTWVRVNESGWACTIGVMCWAA